MDRAAIRKKQRSCLKYLLTSTLLCLGYTGFAQNLEDAFTSYQQYQYTQAAEQYRKFLESDKFDSQNKEEAFLIYFRLGKSLVASSQYAQAEGPFQKAASVAQKTQLLNEYYAVAFEQGRLYIRQNRSKKALQLLDSLQQNGFDSTLQNAYRVPMLEAAYLEIMDEHRKSFSALARAEKLYMEHGQRNEAPYLELLEMKASAYRGIGDRSKNIALLRQALAGYTALGNGYKIMFANYRIAHTFNELEQSDSAIAYYLKAQESAKAYKVGKGFIGMHRGLPALYWKTGRREEADVAAAQLEAVVLENGDPSSTGFTNRSAGYSSLGYYHGGKGDYKTAVQYFGKAIAQHLQVESGKQGLAGLYGAKGRFHVSLGQFDQAHDCFRRQAHLFCFDEKADTNQLPKAEQMETTTYAASSLFNASDGYYYQAFQQGFKEAETLDRFLPVIKEALALNQKALFVLSDVNTQLRYLRRLDRYFTLYLNGLYYAQEFRTAATEVNEAIAICSQYRQLLLQAKLNLEGQDLADFDGFKQLVQLRRDYNKTYYQEANPVLAERLDSLNEQITLLSTRLADESPERFHLLNMARVPSMDSIKARLGTDEALVFFQRADNNLFSFRITRDSSLLKFHLQMPLLDSLKRGYTTAMQSNDAASYQNYAFALAQNLGLTRLPQHKLYVLADAELSGISLESLLGATTDSIADFTSFHYLLRDKEFVYLNHLHELLEGPSQRNVAPQYVAFAPSFGDKAVSQLMAYRSVDRGALVHLPGALDEVQQGGSIFSKANVFVNEEATEKNFKAAAHQANILHFATHAFVNEKDPLGSRLILGERDSSEEDGILYAHELMGLNLKADLAILSACNTGAGKANSVEGSRNLAYALAYSGCKNVVTTHWMVNDQTTSGLMSVFLQQSKEGTNLQTALLNAQRSYLEGADELTANPYFWAAFNLQGPPDFSFSSEPETKSPMLWILIGAVSLIAVVAGLSLRKKS